MKFSDMMGKGSDKASVDAAETTEAAAPTTQWTAAPAPEAPIRFGTQPGEASPGDDSANEGAAVETSVFERTTSQPSIMDVMNELTPRAGAPTAAASAASEAELDTTAWLEGLGSIDDDLLPH